jgi:RNA polymerase sigma factor (sigma-70 family)
MDNGVLALDVARQDRRLVDTIRREQGRLRTFIRKRVADIDDAEDILQDVFCELVEAVRLMQPIEHASAWLFRVARNRITDLYRRRKPTVSMDAPVVGVEQRELVLEDLLPSPDASPDAAYARDVLLDELDAALDDLPKEQRDVFVAHEAEISTVRTHRRDGGQRGRHGPLELVDAHPVWIARNHVLAGPWSVGVQPGPVRSLRRTTQANALASSDDGALESDDACRTREVHGRHERTLRPIRLPGP